MELPGLLELLDWVGVTIKRWCAALGVFTGVSQSGMRDGVNALAGCLIEGLLCLAGDFGKAGWVKARDSISLTNWLIGCIGNFVLGSFFISVLSKAWIFDVIGVASCFLQEQNGEGM